MDATVSRSRCEPPELVRLLAPRLRGQQCLVVQGEHDCRLAIFRVDARCRLKALWRGYLFDPMRRECNWLQDFECFRRSYGFRVSGLMQFAVRREWRRLNSKAVVATFPEVYQNLATIASVWQGDGVYAGPRYAQYRAVWTRASHPFHLWRCRQHTFVDSHGDLCIQSPLQQTVLRRDQIAGVEHSVRDDGFAGGVNLVLRTDERRPLLRLRSLMPLIDAAYDDWERDAEFEWVDRLALRVRDVCRESSTS
ncbi:MAG: hypothetical protein AB7U73_14635 [Pirellulales bacterium]